MKDILYDQECLLNNTDKMIILMMMFWNVFLYDNEYLSTYNDDPRKLKNGDYTCIWNLSSMIRGICHFFIERRVKKDKKK